MPTLNMNVITMIYFWRLNTSVVLNYSKKSNCSYHDKKLKMSINYIYYDVSRKYYINSYQWNISICHRKTINNIICCDHKWLVSWELGKRWIYVYLPLIRNKVLSEKPAEFDHKVYVKWFRQITETFIQEFWNKRMAN